MQIDDLPPDLKPYEADLFRVVYDGLADFHEKYGATRVEMTPRSQRSLCHDCIANEARRRFPDTAVKLNLFVIKIDDKRIKIKALDPALHPSNRPTQMVLDFMRQRIYKLFDNTETVNLVLGYQPHDFDIRQSRVWLTYPKGRNRFNWICELRGERTMADTTVVEITTPQPLTRPRVRAKASPAKGTIRG